ncbi:MAG: efflux RND transporter periplasmic adaptor subunit [Halioglobus sp.]|nr:efflux RND transporter periplasmic adaptor subunit [Halioglobus sp.]
MRAYLFVIVLLMLIFGGIAGYLYSKFSTLAATDFTPPPITIAAATAQTAIWPSQLEAVGTIRAARGVELSSETSGEVMSISVASGDAVKAGQTILTLNDGRERADRRRLEANLKLARQLYERDSRLIKRKTIPQSQYDRSLAELNSAKAQLAETDARLDNKRIIAPFDGTVGIIRVKVGDYIDPGTPITSLQDLSDLEVDFSVPDRYVPNLRPGLDITVSVAAFPGTEFKATVSALDASVDAGTRNLMMRAQLEQAKGLLPGMFARLVVDLNQSQRVVTIPETAVSYSLHGHTVYVLAQSKGQTTVRPRVVRTGETRDGQTAVTDGLLSGEWVVTAGQNKLYRDAQVTIDDTVELP